MNRSQFIESGGANGYAGGCEANRISELMHLLRRMDDLFIRCDPTLCRDADLPEYTDPEWDSLRADVRAQLPEIDRKQVKRRLLILACSSTKRADTDRIPARDRYNGPLWQTLRTVDPTGDLAHVAFLSAHYGLREANSPIPKYDARMTPQIAEKMIRASTYTRWPRQTNWKLPQSGDHAEEHMHSMTHDRRYPFTEVALAGGGLYLEVMRSFVADFQVKRYVTQNARLVEINDSIGIMRRKLRDWLTARPMT